MSAVEREYRAPVSPPHFNPISFQPGGCDKVALSNLPKEKEKEKKGCGKGVCYHTNTVEKYWTVISAFSLLSVLLALTTPEGDTLLHLVNTSASMYVHVIVSSFHLPKISSEIAVRLGHSFRPGIRDMAAVDSKLHFHALR